MHVVHVTHPIEPTEYRRDLRKIDAGRGPLHQEVHRSAGARGHKGSDHSGWYYVASDHWVVRAQAGMGYLVGQARARILPARS
jgi:hypothetical protein